MADQGTNGTQPPKAAASVGSLEALKTLSVLTQRLGLSQALGMQFGGKRDLYEVFGYEKDLTFPHIWNKYRRQDIARRIVSAPAKATWRGRPRIDGGNKFNAAWAEFVKKTKLWQKLERLDRLCSMGPYATLLLGFNSGDPETPVRKGSISPEKVLYLQPHGCYAVTVDKFDEDPRSERYGLPDLYRVSVVNMSNTTTALGGTPGLQRGSITKVWHWTRVLHVSEEYSVDEVYGHGRLEAVYNLLDDLIKIAGGSAETFWLAGNRGLNINIEKDVDLTVDHEKALSDEVEEYMHQLRRVLRTRGAEVQDLGTNGIDPTGVFKTTISLISAATGIPQRILLGAEAGQLASETDRANWAERVEERRTDFAEESVLLPLIDRLVWAGALPEPKPKSEEGGTLAGQVLIGWDSAFRMSPIEAANTIALRARAYANMTGGGKTPIVSMEEARVSLGYPAEVPEEQVIMNPIDSTNDRGSGGASGNPGDQGDVSSSDEPKFPTDRPEPPAPRN